MASPEDDATPGAGNVMAFITENCPKSGCENAGSADVDGGPTYLVSPSLDFSGTDGTIFYSQWLFTRIAPLDVLTIEVSNDDGANWMLVEEVNDTGSQWQSASFMVSDYVEPTANVRVRFSTSDNPNGSVTEAGIDDFLVEVFDCGALPCLADFDGSGSVDAADLAVLLGSWGSCDGCPTDLTGDGTVDASDLAQLLGGWGTCP